MAFWGVYKSKLRPHGLSFQSSSYSHLFWHQMYVFHKRTRPGPMLIPLLQSFIQITRRPQVFSRDIVLPESFGQRPSDTLPPET